MAPAATQLLLRVICMFLLLLSNFLVVCLSCARRGFTDIVELTFPSNLANRVVEAIEGDIKLVTAVGVNENPTRCIALVGNVCTVHREDERGQGIGGLGVSGRIRPGPCSREVRDEGNVADLIGLRLMGEGGR